MLEQYAALIEEMFYLHLTPISQGRNYQLTLTYFLDNPDPKVMDFTAFRTSSQQLCFTLSTVTHGPWQLENANAA